MTLLEQKARARAANTSDLTDFMFFLSRPANCRPALYCSNSTKLLKRLSLNAVELNYRRSIEQLRGIDNKYLTVPRAVRLRATHLPQQHPGGHRYWKQRIAS